MTALRSSKKLALSFLEMEQDDMNQIVTVPPLIRQEVTAIRPERVIIFMDIWLIPGLLIAWRVSCETSGSSFNFFWDRSDAEEVTRIDETLSFHQIDDVKFLNAMAGCKAYASTAGFESICEAMYLGNLY